MNTANSAMEHPLVVSFRQDLRRAMADASFSQQQRVLDDIDEHIVATVGEVASDTEIREVLERLGTAEAIAAEAGSFTRPPSLRREIAAITLLATCGLVCPIAAWMMGVWCMWSSRRWNTRDKLIGAIGTFWYGLGPIGLLLASAAVGPSSPPIGAFVIIAVALATVGHLGLTLLRAR